MLLFELLTGERPFENLTSTAEINQAITKGDRPCLGDANGEPSFPAMIDLMYDCWVHAAGERPSANEVTLSLSDTLYREAVGQVCISNIGQWTIFTIIFALFFKCGWRLQF